MKAISALWMLPMAALIGCGQPCDCDLDGADTGGLSYHDRDDALAFQLSPDVAQAGDVFITSLVANGDDAFDYSRVVSLDFYGAVEVCTSQPRDGELLVSLGVASDAPTREIDLVVVLDDGETIYVEAALTILGSEGGSGEGTADDAMCAG